MKWGANVVSTKGILNLMEFSHIIFVHTIK